MFGSGWTSEVFIDNSEERVDRGRDLTGDSFLDWGIAIDGGLLVRENDVDLDGKRSGGWSGSIGVCWGGGRSERGRDGRCLTR